MFNVCLHCGMNRADKAIVASDLGAPWALAICPECGHEHLFQRLPLFVISGASGTGKTTVCGLLTAKVDPLVLLEGDILWQPEFSHSESDGQHTRFFETWLRMAKNIAQAGKAVALFGAGLGVPDNLERCVERRYVSTIHYLALVCDEDELAARLRARPAWRGCADPSFIEAHLDYNRWFKTKGPALDPAITLLESSGTTVEETAERVKEWLVRDS